jgi:DNA processing protein
MQDTFYKVALGLVPKVGAITAKKLLEYYGSAENVFRSKLKELQNVPGIGPQLAEQIVNPAVLQRAESEFELLERNRIDILCIENPKYPDRLRDNRDSPLVLFSRGETDLNGSRSVAIVGTRKPSLQGIHICQRLIEELADYEVTIISGMAYGIDICAHRAAMDNQMPTWGVMAHGHKYIYPAVHRKTAFKMIEEGGCLLSEYSFSTRAEKEFFPMRNRIVAGLCDALIVIETAKRGGSMITAHLANQYFRDVFAVPGRIKDKQSMGCNHLIKSHQAALIESAADLAYVLRWKQNKNQQGIQQELFIELSEDEKNIVALLQNHHTLGVDEIVIKLSAIGGKISADLLSLEFKGIVKSMPGSRYTLI